MPPSAPDLGAEVAKLVPGEHGWSVLPFVLDLPCPLVHEVSALETELHLWVVAEVNHPIRAVDGAAAPALGAPSIVLVDGSDGPGAHMSQSPRPHRVPEVFGGLAV